MQTRFTPAQLEDPATREMELILRKCVHCGFCTATCPTYVLLGDELDSPRGRIWLIKDMLENDRDATEEVVTHIDRCLSCLACMTTCPSGVHYQHLIDHARAHVEATYRRPWPDRVIRRLLLEVLPYPWRFRIAIGIARRLRSWAPRVAAKLPGRAGHALKLLPVDRVVADRVAADRVPPDRVAADRVVADHVPPDRVAANRVPPDRAPAARTVHGSPAGVRPRSRDGAEHPVADEGAVEQRVALLEGCVESVLAPQVREAATRVLRAAGCEVVNVAGCCGALPHHMGDAARARGLGGALIDRLERAGRSGRQGGDDRTEGGDGIRGRHDRTDALDAIVTTASGCGTHLKDYAHAIGPEASHVAARARDISEWLVQIGLPPPKRAGLLTVAYHSACSLQHGQRIDRAPRELLAQAGFRVVEIAEGHLCCGSAGTYNLLQPQLATALRDRKLGHIAATGADVVAIGNIGCMTQLGAAAKCPVVHTVELLDWALGGPAPKALRRTGVSAG